MRCTRCHQDYSDPDRLQLVFDDVKGKLVHQCRDDRLCVYHELQQPAKMRVVIRHIERYFYGEGMML